MVIKDDYQIEIGTVVHPGVTKSPEAQKFIEQGIGQIHGFWRQAVFPASEQAILHSCAFLRAH